jgi:hypothetical protein
MTNQSEQLDQLFTALAKAQGEMVAAAKDCANPFYKSRYADLSSVWNACREPLSKNGLSVLQIVQSSDLGDVLHTTLGHSSGQFMTSTMPIRTKTDGKSDIQALGSTITYLRRYALSALVGVAPDDDNDGNDSKYKAQPKTEPAVVPVPFVNSSQLSTLRSSMAQCGNEFVTKVMEWLATKGIMSLDKMPITLFEVVKKRIDSHLASDEIQDAIVGEV